MSKFRFFCSVAFDGCIIPYFLSFGKIPILLHGRGTKNRSRISFAANPLWVVYFDTNCKINTPHSTPKTPSPPFPQPVHPAFPYPLMSFPQFFPQPQIRIAPSSVLPFNDIVFKIRCPKPQNQTLNPLTPSPNPPSILPTPGVLQTTQSQPSHRYL